jgi:hypothetical protein
MNEHVAYAASIAALLQGPREDEDMEITLKDDPYERLHQLHAAVLAAVREMTVPSMAAGVTGLERQLKAELDTARAELTKMYEERRTFYVPREVPWTDMAAGMMTIARDGTPWMVELVHEGPPLQVFLRNGDKAFPKDPKPGETVRVLVPYVTPEQAESLVKDQLGGTEVGT